MRRLLTACLAAALLLAGCGEDAGQRAARQAVERHAGGARTRCTQTARFFFTYTKTKAYVCVVDRSGDPLCDQYMAIRKGLRFAVRLRRSHVDCVLPAS
ncbi:MAG TPA: hypothetical protein VH416_05050 [Gaiellaceae bacterium]